MPDIKPKTETFFPDISTKTEIFLPELKPAIKPFPVDQPIPALDNNLDNVDGQTEIFVDEKLSSCVVDLGLMTDTKPDLSFPTSKGNDGIDETNYDVWVNNLQNIRADLFLAERIKKESAPGKFYKSSVQNISFFNKEKIFVISSKSSIDGKTFYWLADVRDNKILKERFQS